MSKQNNKIVRTIVISSIVILLYLLIDSNYLILKRFIYEFLK